MSVSYEDIKNKLGSSLNDFTNRVKATPDNIRKKGILGSIATGAEEAYNVLGNQSTNFGKAYIQGGKSVLFGTDSLQPDIPSTSPTPFNPNQTNQGAAGAQSTSSNKIDYSGTGVKSSDSTPTPSIPISTAPSVFRSGSASVTQSPSSNNRSTINFDNGVGGAASITSNKVFTPDQQSLLAKTIEYNNKPETIANFAKQAAISQARYDDARSKGYFGNPQDDARSAILQNLQNSLASDNQKGIALYKDLLENYDKSAIAREGLGVQRDENSIRQKGIEANTNSDLAKSQQDLLNKANEAKFKANKEQQDAHQKGLGAVLDLKKNLASPIQQLAGYSSFSGKAPNKQALDFVLSDNPDYQEALKLGDTEALKKSILDAGIPPEYLGSIFSEK